MDKRLAPVAFSAPAEFAAPAADGTRRFSGVAYAGGVITDHGWFERVAFDLATTKFATPAPALLSHDAPIGVVDKATVNGEIRVDGKLFADVEGPAKNVADMADRGMPWQLSVYIKPGSIEEYKAGTKVKLNGQTFDGPLTVFRNSRVREVSFCALGADDKTNATVFNLGGNEPRIPSGANMEFTQADIDNAVNAEKAITAAEKARADQAIADLAALQGKFAARLLAERTEKVKALFADTGKTYNDELAKPYLAMDEATYAVFDADLRAAKPKLDTKLTSEQAKGGTEDKATEASVESITTAAQTFIAEQAKIGRNVSVADAVVHVRPRAAA